MSDLTKDRYSLDRLSSGRLTILPKSQPVRLKELMQMCEDDEDDNDDNNDNNDDNNDDNDDDENEKKSCKFENESDPDEPQPLPCDSMEDALQEPPPSENDNCLTESVDGFPQSPHVMPEDSHKSVAGIPYAQKRFTCTNDKDGYRINDVNSRSQLPVESNANQQETHNCKYEEKTQDNNTSVHRTSMDMTTPCPPSLSIFPGNCNSRSETNRNPQSAISDVAKRKEECSSNAPVESKVLLPRASETYLSHSSKEEQRHKDAHNISEQTRKEESQTLKAPSITADSLSSLPQMFGTAMHPLRYSSKYEANEKFTPAKTSTSRMEFSTPSLSDTGKSLMTINRLVSDTPLKHVPINSTHPNPCASHKQLLYTPQSKSADPNKSHGQTPSTMLGNWCYSNVKCILQTEGKGLFAKEHAQTPRNTIRTPIVEKSTRPFGSDSKNVRRPLADAALVHGDTIGYPADPKALLLHARPEPRGTATSEPQQEGRNRKTVGVPDGKLIQTEASHDSDLRPTRPVEETKCGMPDASAGGDGRIPQNQNESKQLMIGSGASTKVVQDISRKYTEQDIPGPCMDLHAHYSAGERRQEEVREIANKLTNVQFTVPTSALPQRQNGKTLFVKDREYLILGSLGRGMSGEVLRVQDLSCGEMRAIKCVDMSKMDKEAAQGCLDEITMLRKLQAPCVIKMFDYHVREFMVYVVMEMGDTDLSRLLKSMSQEKQIPLTMILYYWTEMLTAVKHIHDNGVIHSDLKPGNFLLVRGRLKLIDFGIASNINSDMTSVFKNNPIGTLNYISPEALMDIGGNADSPTHNVKYKISFKSDVWSLGCILYSMVYGYTPFHHVRSQWAKVNAITNPKPNIAFPATTFSTSGGDTTDCERAPPVLIDVMRKCLLHDPKARPTVAQLLQVQYVPTTQHASLISVPDVPANVLVKIKHALSEVEWRQFVQILETKRNHT